MPPSDPGAGPGKAEVDETDEDTEEEAADVVMTGAPDIISNSKSSLLLLLDKVPPFASELEMESSPRLSTRQ